MRPERFSGSTQVPTRATASGGGSPRRWSRKTFLQASAGAAAGGAAVVGLTRPGRALAGPGIGLVDPIPSTFAFFPGVQSHVLAPPFLFGSDSDPATVCNFEGVSGLAYISGTCEQRNRMTGETRELPFFGNDMRFMKGNYISVDGQLRSAAFAFV